MEKKDSKDKKRMREMKMEPNWMMISHTKEDSRYWMKVGIWNCWEMWNWDTKIPFTFSFCLNPHSSKICASIYWESAGDILGLPEAKIKTCEEYRISLKSKNRELESMKMNFWLVILVFANDRNAIFMNYNKSKCNKSWVQE